MKKNKCCIFNCKIQYDYNDTGDYNPFIKVHSSDSAFAYKTNGLRDIEYGCNNGKINCKGII